MCEIKTSIGGEHSNTFVRMQIDTQIINNNIVTGLNCVFTSEFIVLYADGSGKVNEEREQTLNQLLTEMDGFTPDTGVVFIGATNRCDSTGNTPVRIRLDVHSGLAKAHALAFG